MSTLIVRYRPRDEAADTNQALVATVFEALHESRPDGMRYACFRLADGTFIHIADVTADTNPLPELDAFVEFSSTLDKRCDPANRPNPQPAHLIGNYPLVS
jgi:hypothetical protein